MTTPTLLPEGEPQAGGLRHGRPKYLEVRDLSVSFDGFLAVDNVNLNVIQGDLRFLIGPNGAGKTTVIDAITGWCGHGIGEPHRHRDPRPQSAPDRQAGCGAHVPDRKRV